MTLLPDGRSFVLDRVVSSRARVFGFVRHAITRELVPGVAMALEPAGAYVKNPLDGSFAIATTDSAAGAMRITFEKPGFRPETRALVLGAAPIPLEIALEPLPVDLEGIVRDATGASVAGTLVRLASDAAAPAEFPFALRTPAGSSLVAGAAVEARAIALTSLPNVVLVEARAGDRSLVFADRAGIAIGQALALGDADRREIVRVSGLPGSSGWVALERPLARAVPALSPVARAAVGAAAGATTLSRPLRAGDGVAWCRATFDADAVEIAGSPSEVTMVGAVTDATGRFSFRSVSGAAVIRAVTTVGGADHFVRVRLAYELRRIFVELRLA